MDKDGAQSKEQRVSKDPMLLFLQTDISLSVCLVAFDAPSEKKELSSYRK